MSILDTFYILYKADKTDLIKGTKEAEKVVSDFDDKQKETIGTTNKLGSAFLDLASAGVAAFASIFTAGKIKDGILNAENFNAEIERTGKLTNISGNEISAWGGALQTVGGSVGEFQSELLGLNKAYAQAGISSDHVLENLKKQADYFKFLKDSGQHAQALRLGDQLGISENTVLLLELGTKELERRLEIQRQLAPLTQKDLDNARLFQTELAGIGNEARHVFTQVAPLADVILKAVEFTIRGIEGILLAFNDVVTGNWTHLFSRGKEGNIGQTDGSAPIIVTPPANAPLGIRSNNPGNLRPGGAEAQYGSLSEGITAEDANLQRYGRKDYNTLGLIASHWAPPNENDTKAYTAGLANSTGFDPNQPLDLNDPAVRAKILNAINTQEEGKAYGNLVTAAQGQISLADQSSLNTNAPAGGKTNNVQIGNITINTQATDANGIAGSLNGALQQQFKLTTGNYDDGIQY